MPYESNTAIFFFRLIQLRVSGSGLVALTAQNLIFIALHTLCEKNPFQSDRTCEYGHGGCKNYKIC